MNDYLTTNLLQSAQNLVIALLVLLIGWIVAKTVSKMIEGALEKTGLDEKLYNFIFDPESKPTIDINKVIGKGIYYILLIMVLILFFNVLNLHILATPLADLINTLFNFIPAVLKAALILLMAFIIGSIAKWLVITGGKKVGANKLLLKAKVADSIEKSEEYIDTAGKIVFYIILLIFIPGVLDALNIQGVAEPFSGLLSIILIFIPKLLAATIIFAIGWFVAKIIKNIVENLLLAVGSEKLIDKLRLQNIFEDTSLASFVSNVLFVLIIIPIGITSLEQLELRGITDPAISMLEQIMNMIPNIVMAVALILFGIWLGKFISDIVSRLLVRVGFNNIVGNMKLGNKEILGTTMTPANLVGYIVQVLIVFFLTVQALYLIKLDFLVAIATAVTAYLPNVIAAVLILGVALILGNIVEKVIVNLLNGPAIKLLALFAKYSILVLAGFMALTQLGIASSIVSSAFILILGGLSLAFGLSFGLGGKEFASKYWNKIDATIEKTDVNKKD